MIYIGGLTAAWTAMNMRKINEDSLNEKDEVIDEKNKTLDEKVEKLRIPRLLIYWLLFCISFAISYLLLK